MPIDWGDVPTWLAFAGAGAAAWYTRHTLELERGRDARDAAERRQQQASLVSAWIGDVDGSQYGWRGTATAVIVANLSNQPLYAVMARVQPDTGPAFIPFRRSVMAPSSDDSELVMDIYQHPERTAHLLVDGRTWRKDYREIIRDWRITLTFRDAAGHLWTRFPDGRLVERPDLDLDGRPDDDPPAIAGS